MAARRSHPALTWLVLGSLLIALLAGASMVSEEFERGSMFERYSSLKADPEGTLALVMRLEAEGREVRRSTTALLAPPADATVLCIEPELGSKPALQQSVFGAQQGYEGAFSPKELQALEQWVEAGGALVLMSSQPSQLAEAFGASVRSAASEVNAEPLPATPAVYSKWTAGLREVRVSGRSTLNLESASWLVLLRSEHGPVAALRRVGEGLVCVVASPYPATNDGLAEADDAAFMERILKLGRGPVVIDELRHGLVRQQGVTSYLRQQGLHLALFQGLFIYALVWWAISAHSNRMRAPQPTAEIESSQYLTAMANIFTKAKLHGHAIGWYERRLVLLLRGLLEEPEAARFEDFDADAVAERLKELGVKNYQGLRGYAEARLSILSRIRGEPRDRDGAIAWDRARGVPEGEALGLTRLAIGLERDWLSQAGRAAQVRLMRDLEAATRDLLRSPVDAPEATPPASRHIPVTRRELRGEDDEDDGEVAAQAPAHSDPEVFPEVAPEVSSDVPSEVPAPAAPEAPAPEAPAQERSQDGER